MSLIDEIRREVDEIAIDEGIPADRAFGYWFLEKFEDLSPEDAASTVTDGPWDDGRDAVWVDEQDRILNIYQFKYSDDPGYVRTALTDVQRGIIAEREHLAGVEAVRLAIVSIARIDPELHRDGRRVERRVGRWLRQQGLEVDLRLEIVGLRRFLELSDRLYGVDLTLEWTNHSVVDDRAILGRLNAIGLRAWTEDEALFSFNIRRFLGIRKGSVSWKIMGTLDDETKRDDFWILNNGIVCLCTSFTRNGNRVNFRNFTIVNGAQTVNTIAKFLRRNPADTDPIWVVAKVLRVDENEVSRAAEITETSNTQTPTSTRDLRATDLLHQRISEWLNTDFGLAYVYKRGQRAERGSVKMKDLAQAYVAFWREEPHVSFARPGQIFAKSDYYEDAFPALQIDGMRQSGGAAEKHNFLLRRLLPWKITVRAREYLRAHTGEGALDKKWRSLTYHLTWLYRLLLADTIDRQGLEAAFARLDEILELTLGGLTAALGNFFIAREAEIPRVLKSNDAQTDMRNVFATTPAYIDIQSTIQHLW